MKIQIKNLYNEVIAQCNTDVISPRLGTPEKLINYLTKFGIPSQLLSPCENGIILHSIDSIQIEQKITKLLTSLEK